MLCEISSEMEGYIMITFVCSHVNIMFVAFFEINNGIWIG